jgi:hypothetical protein
MNKIVYLRFHSLVLLIFAVALISLSNTSFAGGGWTRDKGKGFAQIGFNNITYTTTYLDDGSLGTTDNLTREITDQTLQLYAEYGLTNNITLLLNAPYKLTEAKKIGASPRPEGSLNGVGNISVGGKYGILKGKINLAATLRYDAQTAKADELTGLRTGYDASVIAPGVAIGLGGNK